jgi:hypothetical protein
LPIVVRLKGKNAMATNLLNTDGTASMATMIMCSHHAFRRDVACFATALADATRSDVLHEEWTRFRAALHGHHTVEDTAMFPDLRAKHPELAAAIDQLDAHHRRIDPLLERGDQVFADLANQRAAALDLITTLAALLAEHLDAEERAIIEHLRGAKEFPLPPTEDVIAMYAGGFAWSSAGISSAVLDQVFAMLPPALVAKIPAARAEFDERCRRVWGSVHTGTSRTSVP